MTESFEVTEQKQAISKPRRPWLVPFVTSCVVTGAVLVGLFEDETLKKFVGHFSNTNMACLLAAFAIAPALHYARAWRFSSLVSGSARLPSLTIFCVTTYSTLFSWLLPFRTGELSLPFLARRKLHIPIATGIGVLLLIRMLDIAVMAGLGGVAGVIVLTDRTTSLASGVVIFASLAVLACVYVITRFARAAPRVSRWRFGAKTASRLFEGVQQIGQPREFMRVVVITTAIWLLYFLICFLSLKAFAVGAGFLQATFAGAAGGLAAALPINGIGGIGPMQGVWALALNHIGVEWTLSVFLSFAAYGIFVSSTIIISAIAFAASVAASATGGE